MKVMQLITSPGQPTTSRSPDLSNVEAILENRPDESLDYDSEAGMSDDAASRVDTESLHIHTEPTGDIILSSWHATGDNFKLIGATEERIKLSYNDTLTIVGQYHLKVRSGVIAIYGAILTARSPVIKVVAPSTELLPVIRCVSGDHAEIVLSNVSANEDMEQLERVNPEFGGIWKCRCSKCSVHHSQRTFTKVMSCPITYQWNIAHNL
jgi:hypothetical protein